MAAWNKQLVLAGVSLARTRGDYEPRALREWSSGALAPVASRLHELTLPTLWIAGARDTKYAAEAHRAASIARNSQMAIVDDAGHRVPWEHPQELIGLLRACGGRPDPHAT
jgi:2-succinyl-6-hydroxy-2,4-cyclohexadiene-1-carboxylate synthase